MLLAYGHKNGDIETVRLCTGDSGREVRAFPGTSSFVFSPDGTLLALRGKETVFWSMPRLSAESFVAQEEMFRHAEEERTAIRAAIRERCRVLQQKHLMQSQAEAEAREKAKKEAAATARLAEQRIGELLEKAQAEENGQRNKWFGKPDYSKAIQLYTKAAAAGSQAAKAHLARLRLI